MYGVPPHNINNIPRKKVLHRSHGVKSPSGDAAVGIAIVSGHTKVISSLIFFETPQAPQLFSHVEFSVLLHQIPHKLHCLLHDIIDVNSVDYGMVHGIIFLCDHEEQAQTTSAS